ncbi:MAG: hypothetical protein DRJ03_01370 [Chloroflexi bacterium]|nr:MAG: hypothetical protein DRJ03_01370 [Chloroflexota bacterium]
MESIFVDNKKYKEFETALVSWLGTPYKHFTMVKGRGADCALFVMACYKEAGVLSHVNTDDYYPKDWWRHGGGEFIRTQFVQHMDLYALQGYTSIWIDKGDEDEMLQGDLIGFSLSKTGITHHCGILLANKIEMIHSINHRGVVKVPYSPWWERHRTGVIRIIKGTD